MTPVALVTGAGTGIGRATAMALSSAGYILALVGRTHDTLEKVAFDIKSARGAANSFVADVSKPAQAEKVIDRVFKAHGRIDAVINNAGMAPAIPLAKMTVAQWHDVLDINLSAAFYTTRAVWPIMERQHAKKKTSDRAHAGGVIVNISSAAARDPFPGLGGYAVAKCGINMLTLMTAREGEAVGIRAHCIAPGAVDTKMLRKLVGDERVTPEIAMVPQDIAAVIVDAVTGSLRYASGETIFLHRKSA